MYNGIIIKESLSDELILDYVEMVKVEIWKTDYAPKYWTAIFFVSKDESFPYELSKVLTGNWFVDMKVNNTKIIVFKNKILKYEIGNMKQKEYVCDECRKLGIPDCQINWEE
ncbi:MAG TPA: hypothetical protein VJZ06_09460 [Mobilitalea sp.]|nr:hypothetical protein [Mobilitalea sp.]